MHAAEKCVSEHVMLAESRGCGRSEEKRIHPLISRRRKTAEWREPSCRPVVSAEIGGCSQKVIEVVGELTLPPIETVATVAQIGIPGEGVYFGIFGLS